MSGWWRVKGGHKTSFTGDRHDVADDVGVNLGKIRLSLCPAAARPAAIGMFEGATFPKPAGEAQRAHEPRRQVEGQQPEKALANRVALVSCVKSKRTSESPARDLYTSPLFTKMRRYAEQHAEAWFILSAEHGVLAPDQLVAPATRTRLTR
jgi:hypothetical protein